MNIHESGRINGFNCHPTNKRGYFKKVYFTELERWVGLKLNGDYYELDSDDVFNCLKSIKDVSWGIAYDRKHRYIHFYYEVLMCLNDTMHKDFVNEVERLFDIIGKRSANLSETFNYQREVFLHLSKNKLRYRCLIRRKNLSIDWRKLTISDLVHLIDALNACINNPRKK